MRTLTTVAICWCFVPAIAAADIIYSDVGGLSGLELGTSFNGGNVGEPLAVTNPIPGLTFDSTSGSPFASPCGLGFEVTGLLASAVQGLYAGSTAQDCSLTTIDTSFVMSFGGVVDEASLGFWSVASGAPTAGAFELLLAGEVQESIALSGLLDSSSTLSFYSLDPAVDSGWLIFQDTLFDSIRWTKPMGSASYVFIDNVVWSFQEVTAVPEPSTLGLLGLGLAGLRLARRRRRSM